MDQRVQFITDYQRGVFDVADLARRSGISRKTACKWIDRYDTAGPARLADRSRRPAYRDGSPQRASRHIRLAGNTNCHAQSVAP